MLMAAPVLHAVLNTVLNVCGLTKASDLLLIARPKSHRTFRDGPFQMKLEDPDHEYIRDLEANLTRRESPRMLFRPWSSDSLVGALPLTGNPFTTQEDARKKTFQVGTGKTASGTIRI
jgi:hypothetical protein